SAGAQPGPACYGQGGTRPTLTDANLLLGYLDPKFFLGGKMQLDLAASEQAIAEGIAKPLGVETLRAAFGIHDIISEDVARAFRIHATERAFDYRQSSMVAFGGSGPLHALRIARKLKIPSVIFPVAAGVMSALGLLESPLAFEVGRSRRIHVADLDAQGFGDAFAELERDAARVLLDAGVPPSDIRIIRRLDMRYQGQGHEIEVALPEAAHASDLFGQIDNLFGSAYEQIYTMRLAEPAEIVNWKVEAVGPPTGLGDRYTLAGADDAGAALKGTRRAFDAEQGRMTDWPVYDRYRLKPGMAVAGPALIEERESTCVVGPGDTVTVDERLNLVAKLDLGRNS
ncbi:MAG: hypothetical protein JSS20_13295, partial [Proteobacteria bacterium]|nr:hypothetical protein [Pseudomonadota bacterium]